MNVLIPAVPLTAASAPASSGSVKLPLPVFLVEELCFFVCRFLPVLLFFSAVKDLAREELGSHAGGGGGGDLIEEDLYMYPKG